MSQSRRAVLRPISLVILSWLVAATTLFLAPSPTLAAYDSVGSEATMLQLVNEARAEHGLRPLSSHPTLVDLARWRSRDMLNSDYFSHTIPSCGCEVYRFYTERGLDWSRGGENIAWNSGYSDTESAQRAFTALMNSPGHRANILNPDFTHIGIGAVSGDGVLWSGHLQNPRIYTQLFMRSSAPVSTAPSTAVSRLSGADRYATSAAISAASFSPGVPVAYVATGANYPDALSGAPAAARAGGPVLLVNSGSVPTSVARELDRLNPRRIVVLGGSGVIANRVVSQLDRYDTGGGVSRIAGADRFATSAAISRASFPAGVETVYIATGRNFPDALAGAAAAADRGAPVLLSEPSRLPGVIASELARLRPNRIVVLGGSAVVSNGVVRELDRYDRGGGVRRIAGADRYATAVAISRASFGSADTAYVATGLSFPDALSAASPAGRRSAPMLLVPGNSVPSSVISELRRAGVDRVVIVGGSSVVTSGAASTLTRV